MPFAHPSDNNNMDNPASSITTIGNGRYGLRRCMAETALGKLWWACDQQQQDSEGEACNVLIFTILPALAQNSVFEQALRQVLPSYQKEAPSQPQITDNGKEEDGTRWLAIRNIRGMLLTERMQELDDRGMPQAQAINILEELSEAISHQRPEGIFGFLEPGIVLFGEGGYRLLNAPVVTTLRLASNGIISHTGKHQSFQSGFISPEVALGDPATPADDTFSLACIAYNLLQGETPYGRQTTLEAAVRNASPATVKKLKPETWVSLQKGLSLKRSERQQTPTPLLAALKPKKPSRLPLVAAGLTIASVVAYASYHLLSGFMQEEKAQSQEMQMSNPALLSGEQESSAPTANPALVGENTPPTQLDQESVDAETARIAAENKSREEAETAARTEAERLAAEEEKRLADERSKAEAEAAAAEAANAEARQQEITKLLSSTKEAISKGKLLSSGNDGDSAADYLFKIKELDAENPELKQLAASMVDDQHSEAANLLASGDYEGARGLLSDADKMITEFGLTDSLQRQVRLETQTEQGNREEQKIDQYLTSARNAVSYGNLVEGDSRSESAMAYISILMDEHPDNPEGKKLLREIVETQQDDTLNALRKNNTGEARKLLDGSQQLISKYMLDDMVEQQMALEKRFRETEKMGIFPASQEPENKEAKPQAANSPRPAPQQRPEPRSEPAPVVETKPEPAPAIETPSATATPDIIPPTDAVLPPVEVTVPPDVPVTEAFPPPGSAEPVSADLPPVQIDIPMVPPPAPEPEPIVVEPQPLPVPETTVPVPVGADPTQPPAVFEIPPNNGNTGNSFTPDVPGLMEVPLDSITESLPPAQ